MSYCKTTDLWNWWSISAKKFQVKKPVFPQELWYLVQSYCDIVGWVIAKDSPKKTALIRKSPVLAHEVKYFILWLQNILMVEGKGNEFLYAKSTTEQVA